MMKLQNFVKIDKIFFFDGARTFVLPTVKI